MLSNISSAVKIQEKELWICKRDRPCVWRAIRARPIRRQAQPAAKLSQNVVSVAIARALCDLDASRKPAYTMFALVCFRDDNVKTVFSVHQMETF